MKAGASRSRLLLAVLLVLLGLIAAPTAGTGHPASATSGSASVASTPDGPHDPLRLSPTAPHAPTTALPNTWWVVCSRAAGACAPNGRTSIGEAGDTAMTAAAQTPRSSRAPPAA